MPKEKVSNDKLDSVTGGDGGNESPTEGGFSITYYDSCHFKPARFKLANGCGVGAGQTPCGCCIYNAHLRWLNSRCDYPNEH